MKTLILALLILTATQQANAQNVATWNLNEGAAATTTAAGIATGGVSYGNAYYQFAMVAASGYSLDLDSVTFTTQHTGLLTWSLRSTLDGYSSDLTTGTLTNSNQVITMALPAAFRSLTGVVRFRLYVNDQATSTSASNHLIETISVAGEAVTGTLAAR